MRDDDVRPHVRSVLKTTLCVSLPSQKFPPHKKILFLYFIDTVSVLYWGSHLYRGLQPGIVVLTNKTNKNNINHNNKCKCPQARWPRSASLVPAES